jgi:ligand-binding sensor domain-containing protein/serine phosphatase RsbU (regulator of sigma subunit)
MKNKFLVSFVFSVFFIQLFIQPTNSQNYKFQQLGVGKGICYPFVYQVTQDKNGFIWALTGSGICRFDGFSFVSKFRDSLPESSATATYKDKNQNLWFGFSDGSIVFYDGKSFLLFPPDSLQSGSINDIIQDNYGNIIAATQGSGLIIFNGDNHKRIVKEPFAGKLIYSIASLGKELLIGSDDGISLYSYGSDPSKIKFLRQIEGLPLSKVQKISKNTANKSFWICTEDAGFYLLKQTSDNSFKVLNYGILLDLGMDKIQDVNTDQQKNIWVSTFGKGLYKVKLHNDSIQSVINFNVNNGLALNDVKATFQDREGNIWVSTFGNGISMLLTESFISYDYSSFLKGKNVSAVCFDTDGYWVGGEKGLIKVTRNLKQDIKVFNQANGLPSDIITALYLASDKSLIIGTSKSGVYQVKCGSNKVNSLFKSENSLANSINALNGYKDEIYISSNNGIYQYNLKTGSFIQHSTDQGKHLPHNNIRQVFVNKSGIAWVATQSSMLFNISNDEKFVSKGAHELEFTAITNGENGSLWAGTNGNGVFKFAKDTVLHYSTRENLKSDYCYALATDNSGNVWIGHRLGLSRISPSTPPTIKIYGPDYIPGDVNPNAIAIGSSGEMLFGTSEGLIFYESTQTGVKPVAPLVNITSIVIDDKNYDPWSEKIVLRYGRHRIKIDFIGLNYNNPEQVVYKYKLDGFDTDWIETKEPFARFIVDDGIYTFKLLARSGDGVWSEKDYSFILKVRKPFWKTWWFFILAIAALIFAVYTIIKIREKKQREFQIYLEKLLDERTKEVREQKEEIELKNRDITDSINYAQRIQASILPSLRKLQHYFTGSFVYYQPRDIVSGDFYWFDVIPNTNKFIVVCADSTGHGVPGAFMSLIGTTLLKDIFNRPDVQKPSDILLHLDNELKSTLNQNLEGERPNDGMDIIVCEIDIITYKACFASAMRPFIVYQNGEQLYYKGSRSSIGGQIKEEKIFEDVELQLTKGDLIYMFSDGYPDQFGGPHGKKFKMVRLRNLLKDIHQKPMEEQYNYVKSNFELWQGNLEQVDDVIFMGIKI